ncbi:unnamed protein product [Symbiodinium sp. CCMP2592]|nr:unnamed protein product [Symbiodinium sp. CCMP2592]
MEMDFGEGAMEQELLAQEAKSAEATSRGKRAPKAKAKQLPKTCFVCPEPCCKGKRWCLSHNRQYDCLYYQAKSKGETATLEQAVINANRAREVFLKFSSDNPSDGKWRRKSLIDWSAFRREFVVARTVRYREGTTPYEYGQWLKRGENIMGWSKEQSKSEWEKYLADESIERDSLGIGNSLRLWLPVVAEKHRDKDRTVLAKVEEGSQQYKNLSEADRDILMKHAGSTAGLGQAESWLRQDASMGEELVVTPQKRKQSDENEDKDAEIETPEAKRKRMRFEKMTGAALSAFKNTKLELVREKAEALEASLVEARTKLQEASEKLEQETAKDAVMTSYEKTIASCQGLVDEWKKFVAIGDDAEKNREAVAAADQALKEQLATMGDVALVKADAVLHSKTFFKLEAQAMLQLLNAQAVDDTFTRIMKQDAAVVELFSKALKKVGTDVVNYIKQKEKKDEENKELQKVREHAKAAAAKVKLLKGSAHKVFGIDQTAWNAFVENDGKDFDVAAHLDKPSVLRACEQAKTWRNQGDVTVKLSEFGGVYKKANSFKAEGRAIAAVIAKCGKEAAEALMHKVFPCDDKRLDLSTVKEGELFHNNLWYVGFDNKMAGCWLCPNGAAMIRVLAMGSMNVVAFPVEEVASRLSEKVADPKCDDLIQYILDFAEDADKSIGWAATVKQDDVAFIPQGWIIAEQCNGTTPLVYGVRKSYMLTTEASKTNYGRVIEILRNTGRDVAKMEEFLALYDESDKSKDKDPPADQAVQEGQAAE